MLFFTWMTLETMQYRNSDFCRDLLPWVIMANSTFNNSFRHIYSYGVSSDRNTGYSDHLCHHVRLKICIYTQRKKSFMEKKKFHSVIISCFESLSKHTQRVPKWWKRILNGEKWSGMATSHTTIFLGTVSARVNGMGYLSITAWVQTQDDWLQIRAHIHTAWPHTL